MYCRKCSYKSVTTDSGIYPDCQSLLNAINKKTNSNTTTPNQTPSVSPDENSDLHMMETVE